MMLSGKYTLKMLRKDKIVLLPFTAEIQRCLANSHKQHLDVSRIHPSSSPCALPAFIVPKLNSNILPCWVNNFHQLNENTITDSHPLPCIDNILADCTKGKIWGTIDMTNSFFQMRMHPDHIHLTVVNTPLDLYTWVRGRCKHGKYESSFLPQ